MCSSKTCKFCSTVNWEDIETCAHCQKFKMYPFICYCKIIDPLYFEIPYLSIILFNPCAIFNCKVGISRSFRISRQEDAHELMVRLLESMHKCCLPSGVPSGSPSAYEKSLVHRIFGGLLRSQVNCQMLN